MGELIEHADEGGNVVRVNGERGESIVPVKVYQDVYHQITGRTEEIRKRYSENILVTFDEIEQLHHKLKQICDVHNIVASNEVVTVFHEKERKEQFTSFERFRAYNANAASPTVSVVLKYNFSILLPGLTRPQEYAVTVRLASRVALLKQIQEEAPPFVRGRICGFMTGHSAEVKVEYADYVVARAFLEAFDEWIRGCNKSPERSSIRWLQRHSHMLPQIGRVSVGAATVYFALAVVAGFAGKPAATEELLRFAVVYVGGFHILMWLAWSTFKTLEESIDSYTEISYLSLNKGDKNLIDAFWKNNWRVYAKAGISVLGAIAIGILSNKLSNLV